MANIPVKVEARLKAEIPVFQKILDAARSRDVNEADTVVIITDMLERVFGMDKFLEVTREYAIKNTYVDLAVKIDGKIEYLIEVKAIGLALKENHIRQAVDYAAKEGIRWVVLTNGVMWEVHRVTVEGQVDNEQVVAFNFLARNRGQTTDMDSVAERAVYAVSRVCDVHHFSSIHLPPVTDSNHLDYQSILKH